MEVNCTLCGQPEKITNVVYLPLYVVGSEGCATCFRCRMILTGVATGIRERCNHAKLAGFKKGRRRGPGKQVGPLPNQGTAPGGEDDIKRR